MKRRVYTWINPYILIFIIFSIIGIGIIILSFRKQDY